VDLLAGLAAHIVMDGGIRDLAHAATEIDIQNAVPCPGRRGQAHGAYRFDGKTSQIQISGNPALGAAGSLTMSAWIRPRVPAVYAAWAAQTHSRGRWSRWRLGFGTADAAEWGSHDTDDALDGLLDPEGGPAHRPVGAYGGGL
jgi:hypothetical protein